jgi:glycosyltransferase involved in cell wall biosynthesis
MNKILFISHDAARTGAPILLIQILRWLRREKVSLIQIVLINGGELEPEFKALGRVIVINRRKNLFYRLVERVSRKVLIKILDVENRLRFKLALSRFRPDIIYANTAISLVFLASFNFIRRYPVLCHVHELEFIIENLAGKRQFMNSIPLASHFISVAEAVQRNLVTNYSVRPEKISVIPEPLEIVSYKVDRNEIRKELNVPVNAFLVVGAGTVDWRKGCDLFIQTAYLTCKRDDTIYFVWFGNGRESTIRELEFDLEKLNLTKAVQFVGAKPDLIKYFTASDLFYLTSREDPYPLVCLEAASQGIPILCFDNSGGMPEFVIDETGYVIPYLDLAQAADRILELKNGREKLNALGKRAKQKVIAESDINVVGPKVWSVIEKNMTANRAKGFKQLEYKKMGVVL